MSDFIESLELRAEKLRGKLDKVWKGDQTVLECFDYEVAGLIDDIEDQEEYCGGERITYVQEARQRLNEIYDDLLPMTENDT